MKATDIYPKDYDEDEDTPKVVECKICGKGNLAWEQSDEGKWLLYNVKTGAVHSCTKQTPINLDTKVN